MEKDFDYIFSQLATDEEIWSRGTRNYKERPIWILILKGNEKESGNGNERMKKVAFWLCLSESSSFHFLELMLAALNWKKERK